MLLATIRIVERWSASGPTCTISLPIPGASAPADSAGGRAGDNREDRQRGKREVQVLDAIGVEEWCRATDHQRPAGGGQAHSPKARMAQRRAEQLTNL